MGTINLESDYEIVVAARKGINSKMFYDFAKSIDKSGKQLASMINISIRTINLYRNQNKNLDPVHSEHLLKIIALFKKGKEIFGTTEEFNYWLSKPLWGWKRLL
ncbi:hypothetical protein [Membranihabitans maritimus]|uniref:hypothetical protein n=1 Tax=Membranihabitans maritimus TaxID=2904244 RepID=UPI001F15FD5E|nr:hypothetical protein [Membranihabitans maritimus]